MNDRCWIKSPLDSGFSSVTFSKDVDIFNNIKKAIFCVSAVGLYVADINSQKVGDRLLTPGYTDYTNRLFYQTYDVTEMLDEHNTISITVAPGWAVGHFGCFGDTGLYADHMSTWGVLEITYVNDSTDIIFTDETWNVYTSKTTFSGIYDGETVDHTHIPQFLGKAVLDTVGFNLVEDNGSPIKEQEIIAPLKLITTPKGEHVLDFGQNMAGYVSLNIKGNKGERVVLSFGEVLDNRGNFYNENYRAAKNCITYILSGENDYFKPHFSFQGFRYVRIDEYPNKPIDINCFRAIAVHSDMIRTSNFICGNTKINQLYHNIVWGQKSNYVDVPTDCPQRNERLGWTGDTQVFTHIAAINYDVRRFFQKWLCDLRLTQYEDGAIPGICPDSFGKGQYTRISAGWGDVATITPWTLYMIYGDRSFLEDNYEMMKRWVEYIRRTGDNEYLWLSGYHYGDWLAMDAGEDSYVGATSNDLIASAFFINSIDILIKAGEILEKDVSEYKELHKKAIEEFHTYFMDNGMPKEELPFTEMAPEINEGTVDTVRKGITQTAIVLILHFNICYDTEREKLINKLEELIHNCGDRMSTGFLGTPYILHVLSNNGKSELAYKLLFNEKNPSWLYSVNNGATTMWEHWNGIKEDGSFWSTDMNSFNHYAYGAVGDWLYETIAGIRIAEEGYKKIVLRPMPDKRIGFVNSSIDTVNGTIVSNWYYCNECIHFEFIVPEGINARVMLPNGYVEDVCGGAYRYSTEVQ